MIRRALPILVGVGLVLAMVWTARPAGSGLGWRLAFVGIYGLGFVLLLAYLRRAVVSTRELLIGAVLFRLVALPMLPSLSDDGYRYLWDGVVAVEAGVSPYALRPDAYELRAWQDGPLYERMNSRSYYTVYPPASQLVFRLAASVYSPWGWAPSWWVLKMLLVLAELGGVLLLARVVGATATALYAWSPLAVIEIAGQGHTEALVVGGVALVLAAGGARLPWRSLGATVAGLAKLYPLALLPATWRRDGWRGVLGSVVLSLGLGALVWAPGSLGHVRESLELFFGTFDLYGGPYRVLKALAYPILGDAAGRTASLALGACFAGAIAAALAVDDGTDRGLRRVVLTVVIGFVLTAATFHPWYGLPSLLIMPLLQSKRWILWVIGWSAATYIGYEWSPAFEIAILIGWGGGALLLVRDWRRRASAHGHGATVASTSSTVVEDAGRHDASS